MRLGRYNRFAMSQALRSTILWLVMIALPIQGYAAAGMIACGSKHAAEAVGEASPEEASHCDRHAEASTPVQGGEAPMPPGGEKCPSCDSCCTASAAPAPSFPALASRQHHGAVISFAPRAEYTIVTGRLDRPPAPFLV